MPGAIVTHGPDAAPSSEPSRRTEAAETTDLRKLTERLRAEGVDVIRVSYPDMIGVDRGRDVLLGELGAAVSHGLAFWKPEPPDRRGADHGCADSGEPPARRRVAVGAPAVGGGLLVAAGRLPAASFPRMVRLKPRPYVPRSSRR